MIDSELVKELRSISIKNVLICEGAVQDRHDKNKWHTANGKISITDQKFYNWHSEKGGYGAIDLIKQICELDFINACNRLSLQQGKSTANFFCIKKKQCSKKKLILPKRDNSTYIRVLHYLCVKRKIPVDIIISHLSKGVIYSDINSNAIFMLLGKGKQPVGAEIKGTQSKPWKGMATGSLKSLGFFYAGNTRSKTAILCESAIDALSCLSFNPDTQCISTAGAYSTTTWMPLLFKKKKDVFCGYDNDEKGESAFREMKKLHPQIQRLPPKCKDWNEDLI